MKLKQAVAAIIFNLDHTQVLLLKRRDIPVWVLPGGGIEQGESAEDAACREVLEETGCRVEILRKVATYLPVNRLTQLTHFFECRILSGDLQIGKETREIQFFSLTALPYHLPLHYHKWIEDACLHLTEPLNKKIEGVSYLLLLRYLCTHPLIVIRFLLTKIGIHINT